MLRSTYMHGCERESSEVLEVGVDHSLVHLYPLNYVLGN